MLTKFDKIDGMVGSAISMTCISGQPIVGTRQTYTNLKSIKSKVFKHRKTFYYLESSFSRPW